jgi:hypothetical protein
MLHLANCETCVNLMARENRLRASYDAAIKTLYDFGSGLSPDKYRVTRMLADEMWDSLALATRELLEHQRDHAAKEQSLLYQLQDSPGL